MQARRPDPASAHKKAPRWLRFCAETERRARFSYDDLLALFNFARLRKSDRFSNAYDSREASPVNIDPECRRRKYPSS